MYIEKAILHAGGCPSQIATTNVQTSSSSNSSLDSISQVQDWLKEMRSGIIVMASVFVALSFEVALTPPGGMWSDWGQNGATSNASTNVPIAHQPGKPILYDLDRKLFKKLMEFNRATFFYSIATIILTIQPFTPQSSLLILFVLYVAILTLVCMVTEFLYMDSLLTGKSFNIPVSSQESRSTSTTPFLPEEIELIEKTSSPRYRKFIAKFKSLVRKINAML
ncbi:UNVERIFIED_CONTAM: hypothetical protein Slati_4440300 [Sesamum latifolium]|uniref:PGG domain-containing protein n=1 Tax=Sesamum latifolium TaxID=2727402 RepID=A0AAW2SSV7_9LAMI